MLPLKVNLKYRITSSLDRIDLIKLVSPSYPASRAFLSGKSMSFVSPEFRVAGFRPACLRPRERKQAGNASQNETLC